MELLLALIIGILYGTGIYMILRKSMVKLLIGFMLIGNGSNLLIFLLGRLKKGAPPIIPEGVSAFIEAYTDPVPQALILTAIVISFGLQAFAIILIQRVHKVVEVDDVDQLNTTDRYS